MLPPPGDGAIPLFPPTLTPVVAAVGKVVGVVDDALAEREPLLADGVIVELPDAVGVDSAEVESVRVRTTVVDTVLI